MDTFSSSISTNLQVPKPFNPHHHLKPTHLSPHHHHNHNLNHHPSSAAKTTATSSISTLPQKDNFTPLFSSYSQKRTPSPLSSARLSPPRASIHRRAASGYAAALLEISQRNGVVLKVEKDVRRLLRLVFRNSDVKVSMFMKDEWVEEKQKGEVIVELMEKAKFEGHLFGLVNMLVKKGQSVDLVKEVLVEFLRVFQQLTTTSGVISQAPTSRLALS